ncbi:secretory pathway protein Sec39-domain-containing protein [Auriculariales sp. MPI-PUGE-AT-0066]|nr:secretory pathway protein Sec39-domain-containing protein [Auriculariales sp. MPI-PUGE-AT-0066]
MNTTTSHEVPSDAARIWAATEDNAVTSAVINETLLSIRDDLWVTTACVERILDGLALERELVDLGLKRSERLVAQAQEAVAALSATTEDVGDNDALEETVGAAPPRSPAEAFFTTHAAERQACSLRALLLQRHDLLDTYQELMNAHALVDTPANPEEDEDDDPWADTNDSGDEDDTTPTQLKLTLSQFLRNSLVDSTLELATMSAFKAISILTRRHHDSLWHHRFHLLERIPEHNHPSHYLHLLPRTDASGEHELVPEPAQPVRKIEWCERAEVVAALSDQSTSTPVQAQPALTAAELSEWYRLRALTIERRSGMVDVALAFVQYGVSQGVTGLDELGEELSLLERLVYDSPQPVAPIVAEDWTLERWRALEPLQVVKACLQYSTPADIAEAIRRLVLPYLYVLEARAERNGTPDSNLPLRILTEYLLDAPLPLLAAVFESSKPTLSTAQRIVKNDAHMARLALACLYGSDSLHEWSIMSRIFECLPAWEGAQGADEEDEADTTLTSLGAFVTPSPTRFKATAEELMLFFTPLPAFALSRALDVLDVHLDSGEILARWSVPAPLRWFLQSSDNEQEQRGYATRMAHRAGGGRLDELENEDDWQSLMDDMLKLATSGKGPLAGPFGRLEKTEVLKIFFHGLLSSARFDIAKALLKPSGAERPLEPSVTEELVLSVAQEFYDNAMSGNLHTGDMRLAYECLTVAPTTAKVRKERDFIEATSRICSFNVQSRSGHSITPIEIRLEKDRLSLIARVLASTDDAYKHSQVMIELANKLGVPGDARVYGMLADAALAAEDFSAAKVNSGKMIAAVETKEDAEVAWRTAFQLGRQAEWTDLVARLRLLAHAARLCPPEHTMDILATWRRVEAEHRDERRDKPKAARKERPKPGNPRDAVGTAITSLASRLPGVRIPASPATSDTAARVLAAGGQRAAATLSRVAGAFPFGGGHARSDNGEQRSRTPDVSSAAKHALSRGVGWLIGDD